MRPIREWQDVYAEKFRREIATVYEPAVMRGVVRDWPIVREGLRSPEALATYLAQRDSGSPVDAILLAPEKRGRIFYDAAMTGFNFARRQLPFSQVLEQVARYSAFDNAPSVAVQSALLATCAPTVAAENPLPLLHPSGAPRLWLGNAIVTPAHFDESSNVACVVGGRRRFTLLPPEQVGNLYIGPLDFAPTGTPISLVDFRSPDFPQHRRFREAQQAMLVAELEPGDAIFIPPLWWHHVESLARFNVLVNFWWHGAPEAPIAAPALSADMIGRLVGQLDEEQQRAWRSLLAHRIAD